MTYFFDILYRWWRYLWSCFNLERITWSAGLLRTRNYWRGNPLQEEIIDWKAFISPHQLNRERLSQIWWNWTFREKKIAHKPFPVVIVRDKGEWSQKNNLQESLKSSFYIINRNELVQKIFCESDKAIYNIVTVLAWNIYFKLGPRWYEQFP